MSEMTPIDYVFGPVLVGGVEVPELPKVTEVAVGCATLLEAQWEAALTALYAEDVEAYLADRDGPQTRSPIPIRWEPVGREHGSTIHGKAPEKRDRRFGRRG